MNYSQFQKLDILSNVYVINGDGFLLKECLNVFKQKLNIQSEYDVSRFDSENFSCDAVIESCEQISFFAQNRLVVVSNLNKVLENDKKKLALYVQNVNPNCTLIFVDNLSQKMFDFLKVEEINLKLSDFELENLVDSQFAKHNKKIDFDAKQELISACNKDASKICMEIAKLASYANDKQVVKIQDIKLLVPQSMEIVVFELTTALGEKNAQKSLSILFNLLNRGEESNKLFALLSNNFQRMFFSVVSKNLTDAQIATKFNVKEFAIKKAKQQAKNFSVPNLKNIVYELCEVEFMFKNGLMNAENALVYIVEYILNLK